MIVTQDTSLGGAFVNLEKTQYRKDGEWHHKLGMVYGTMARKGGPLLVREAVRGRYFKYWRVEWRDGGCWIDEVSYDQMEAYLLAERVEASK